jgi:hypothetical protein
MLNAIIEELLGEVFSAGQYDATIGELLGDSEMFKQHS